jgi:hypothetical protein
MVLGVRCECWHYLIASFRQNAANTLRYNWALERIGHATQLTDSLVQFYYAIPFFDWVKDLWPYANETPNGFPKSVKAGGGLLMTLSDVNRMSPSYYWRSGSHWENFVTANHSMKKTDCFVVGIIHVDLLNHFSFQFLLWCPGLASILLRWKFKK